MIKRVYSYNDLPKLPCSDFRCWDTVDITNDETSINKIYEHIITSDKIVYYVSNGMVELRIKTKKWGYVHVAFHWGLLFFEFGVSQSHTRYDIDYPKYIKKASVDLYNYLVEIEGKAKKAYLTDKNL